MGRGQRYETRGDSKFLSGRVSLFVCLFVCLFICFLGEWKGWGGGVRLDVGWVIWGLVMFRRLLLLLLLLLLLI